jgi:hypothetical protein
MKGCFWNIRGLNNPRRKNSLISLIRSNALDFVGVVETKKESFLPSFLDSLGGGAFSSDGKCCLHLELLEGYI